MSKFSLESYQNWCDLGFEFGQGRLESGFCSTKLSAFHYPVFYESFDDVHFRVLEDSDPEANLLNMFVRALFFPTVFVSPQAV